MSFLNKIKCLAHKYFIPTLPDELKHGKTEREKQYLKYIDELLAIVRQDPMTGLTHKEHFKAQEKKPGVYILVDGDGLKKINDTLGHSAGHAAILALSTGIKGALRGSDVTVTRAGGDEFIVHVEHASIPTGITIAKRILENIRKQRISEKYTGADENVKKALEEMDLKASLGVGYSEEDADKALYKAKEKGRNRVEFHKE
ncbi:MAG: GGDEF domain-containing protein [Deltaproteobacteria bacterium]|nr:MAG: GGDEF domain-containing protein [Deltaproteobacteria bacterium]